MASGGRRLQRRGGQDRQRDAQDPSRAGASHHSGLRTCARAGWTRRVSVHRDDREDHRRRGARAALDLARNCGPGRPAHKAVSDTARGCRKGRGLRRPDPRRRLVTTRSRPVDRVRQPAQGCRAERRADRRTSHRDGSARKVTKEIGRLLTAMITPFKADGAVDYAAAEKLAVMLVHDGSDGVVVSGTTGESPALSDAEKIELVRAVKGAIPDSDVVAGTGSNDTHHSVELSKLAMKAGADALLAVVHYYNNPPQDGMYDHFKAISELGQPIMYNIQPHTHEN